MRHTCKICVPVAQFYEAKALETHMAESHGCKPHIQMTVENTLDIGMVARPSFNQYANVFNTPKQAMTFVAAHRPGHVVVKVGRKYVPATVEFAKRMGLKVISN